METPAPIPFGQCACGERRHSALQINPRNYKGAEIHFGLVCGNCVALDRKSHRIGRCSKCEQLKPIERDHVYGRANSNVLQDLCINDHRCKSRRETRQRKLQRFRDKYDANYRKG